MRSKWRGDALIFCFYSRLFVAGLIRYGSADCYDLSEILRHRRFYLKVKKGRKFELLTRRFCLLSCPADCFLG